MRSPPEDARRWPAAIGLLAGPAASVLALPRPRPPRPADLDRRGRPAPLLRLAFSEDILSGLDRNAVELRRRSTPAPLLPASLALSSALYAPWATFRPAQTRRLVSPPRPPTCGSSTGAVPATPGQIQRGRKRFGQRNSRFPHVHWARDQPFEPGG